MNPFTHVYVFNIGTLRGRRRGRQQLFVRVSMSLPYAHTTFPPLGMPADLLQHIFDLIVACDTVKYAIIYPHGPVTLTRLTALGEVSQGAMGDNLSKQPQRKRDANLSHYTVTFRDPNPTKVVDHMSMSMPGGSSFEGYIIRVKANR